MIRPEPTQLSYLNAILLTRGSDYVATLTAAFMLANNIKHDWENWLTLACFVQEGICRNDRPEYGLFDYLEAVYNDDEASNKFVILLKYVKPEDEDAAFAEIFKITEEYTEKYRKEPKA